MSVEAKRTHYARCQGADIKACEDCKRLIPFGEYLAQHQARISPATDGRRCGDHLPTPHRPRR
jgi:hypothetical protein